MFHQLFPNSPSAVARHYAGRFCEERAKYLAYCASRGGTRFTLQVKARELLWAARFLEVEVRQGINQGRLDAIAAKRSRGRAGKPAGIRVRFVNIVRPWLRFLGWWQEQPRPVIPFQAELEQYCKWMDQERGFTENTVYQLRGIAAHFLIWYAPAKHPLSALQPTDIDNYLAHLGTHGWTRISIRGVAKALRCFLRYASGRSWCASNLAKAIRAPRVYTDETLPRGPAWTVVQRLLREMNTDRATDIRDRAIVMLLSIYGFRRGEVTKLTLDDLDWDAGLISVTRLKRRQPQTYPLLDTVGNAIIRYIREVRPASSSRQIFLGLHSPHRPIAPQALHKVVCRRLEPSEPDIAHHGPHSLRHACARHLVADKFSLKEIGDHLGHRSSASTRIYAKVDLLGLREVAAFDLGDLP